MQKQSFTYRKLGMVFAWGIPLATPFIFCVSHMLEKISGALYWILNIGIMIVLVFVTWRMMNVLPGVKRTGYYWKENGRTVIEFGKKKVLLDSVTELFLTDKHASSQGINLFIRNNGKKIDILSDALDINTNIEDTTFYTMFVQILSENPSLIQNKDIWGNPIDRWYKKE